MKTRTVIEQPLITLYYSAWNTPPVYLDIFSQDLRKADIGTEFSPSATTTCGRAVDIESLTVVYRDEYGVSCLLRRWGTEDTPSAEPWESKPELIWFELRPTKSWEPELESD